MVLAGELQSGETLHAKLCPATHALNDKVNLLVSAEAADAETDRGVGKVLCCANRTQNVGRLK